MRGKILISILFINFLVSTAQVVYKSVNQQVTVKRIRTFVSPFLTEQQYVTLFNMLTDDLFAGKTFDEIKSEALNDVLGVLTPTQYMTAISKATSLMSLGDIGTIIANLLGVMGNNFKPFFAQIVAYVAKLKAEGMQQKGIERNVYRIVNSFATKKRIKTIFTRVSLKFTAAQWTTLVKSLNGLIAFTKNGF